MIKMIVFNIFDDCNPETILPKQSPIWKTTAKASLKNRQWQALVPLCWPLVTQQPIAKQAIRLNFLVTFGIDNFKCNFTQK
jgi:hypothetical protein